MEVFCLVIVYVKTLEHSSVAVSNFIFINSLKYSPKPDVLLTKIYTTTLETLHRIPALIEEAWQVYAYISLISKPTHCIMVYICIGVSK